MKRFSNSPLCKYRALRARSNQTWASSRPIITQGGSRKRLNGTPISVPKGVLVSVTGNRTLVSRVTGGDTSHYTIAEHYLERGQTWTDDFRVWNPMLYQLSYTSLYNPNTLHTTYTTCINSHINHARYAMNSHWPTNDLHKKVWWTANSTRDSNPEPRH
jgi:hypothetical protein